MTQLIAKRLVAMVSSASRLNCPSCSCSRNFRRSTRSTRTSVPMRRAGAIKIESKLLGYNRPIVVTSTSATSATSSTATLESRYAPDGRSPQTWAPTCRRPSSWPVSVCCFPSCWAASSGLATSSKSLGAGLFRVFMLLGASTPPFLLALLGLIVFYHDLNWLPATGRTSLANPPTGPTPFLTIDTLFHGEWFGFTDAVGHLILPGLCIAIFPAVSIGRVFRSSLGGDTPHRLCADGPV